MFFYSFIYQGDTEALLLNASVIVHVTSSWGQGVVGCTFWGSAPFAAPEVYLNAFCHF